MTKPARQKKEKHQTNRKRMPETFSKVFQDNHTFHPGSYTGSGGSQGGAVATIIHATTEFYDYSRQRAYDKPE